MFSWIALTWTDSAKTAGKKLDSEKNIMLSSAIFIVLMIE
jgi:ABC-type lipoprotein release transport system permease subunit